MTGATPAGAAALLLAAGPGTEAVSPRGGMLDDVAVRVTSPVFVGRAEQMSAFDDVLERVRNGSPAALIIGGEAGVGKSRFLAEFSARARDAGARVLTGGCFELAHGGLPFAPFTAALRELVRDLGADGVAQLLGGQSPQELARLLPELGARTSGPGEGADQDEAQARLFEQFLSLFEALADRGPSSREETERAPLVLIIEDLHWAERSSRDLLTFLIRNLPVADGLLIAASYRSDELHRTHPLRPLLAELGRIDWVELTELPRLTPRQCTELAARILGREPERALADSVYQRTEGNPLFVEALLSSGRGPGRARSHLPESLRDLLAASVQRLPEETQEVLRVASAGGERVNHALLAAVTGLPGDRLSAALRPAVAGNVLVTDDEGYLFRHALIREVVYEDLLPGENSQLHTRFADAIGADPSLVLPGRAMIELAHHAYAAHDMPEALVAAWRAAQEAGQGLALAEEASLLSRVLELWDKVPDAARRIGADHVAVLAQAARSAADAWDQERAVALAGAALKEVDAAADPVRAADLLRQRGDMRYDLGRLDGALSDLREALRLVPENPPSAVRADVLKCLAWALHDSSPDEALEMARESLAVASAAGDTKGEINGLMTMAAVGPGRGIEGAGTGLEGIPRAREAAQRTGYRLQLHVAITESHLLEGMGEHEGAAAAAREGMAMARTHGLARTDGSLLAVNLAEPLVSLGRWGEAMEVIEHALELAPPPKLQAGLHLLAAEAALGRGDVSAAAEHAQIAAPLRQGFEHEGQYSLPLARVRAELHMADGRPADALTAVEDVLEGLDVPLIPRYGWPLLVAGARACEVAILAATAARDQELAGRAEALLSRLRGLAGRTDAAGLMLQAYRLAFAAQASETNDPAQALTAWDDAAAAWERASQPYQRAAAMLRAAQAALAAGDRDGAEVRLLKAAQLAGGLGAGSLSSEIRLLARRGRIDLARAGADAAGSGTADSGLGRLGLTEREFEVLRLVASGQTNREIADQLFISVKTASVHVSNILAKLSASSRVEAAATAHRLHLFDALLA
jgi:DNA-binding CsgD family transcriptional regulator/tetratricopeptide (TPR) repeat protein